MKHDKATRALVRGMIVSLMPMAAAWAGPVNVNTADASTIAKELEGIGPAKAAAIVEYRQKNGPFKSADELVNVKGIGLKTVEKNRDLIRTTGAAPAKPASP